MTILFILPKLILFQFTFIKCKFTKRSAYLLNLKTVSLSDNYYKCFKFINVIFS